MSFRSSKNGLRPVKKIKSASMAIFLIYTNDARMFISSEDLDWSQCLYRYTTNLSFESKEDLVDYLVLDYKLNNAAREPLCTALDFQQRNFLELILQEGQWPQIKPQALSLDPSNWQLVDWEDWLYVLTHKNGAFSLWVYVGGHAHRSLAITLNAAECAKWSALGRLFLSELSQALRIPHSPEYAAAIQEGRKLL